MNTFFEPATHSFFASSLAMKTPAPTVIPDDKVSKRKLVISTFAKRLRQETSTFLDQSGSPRLPIFFIKGFNFLKEETKRINQKDGFLDIIPYGIQMQLLTEYGPSIDFPKTMDTGLLEDTTRPLGEDVAQFYTDVVDYVKNYRRATGKNTVLPYSYYLMMTILQRRLQKENTEKTQQMIEGIPEKMQNLNSSLLDLYVEPSTMDKLDDLMVNEEWDQLD